jgi:N-acetylglucosamine-6-phosphate deacetylase
VEAERLADGTIAGSTATLIHCLRTAVSMDIPLADAVRCATANPARVIGLKDAGAIAEGLRADLLLCGGDLSLKTVLMGGEALH